MISSDAEDSLYGYIGGILNNNGSKLIIANGTANHSHLLISLSKNIGLSKLIGDVKRDSSKHIKTIDDEFSGFQWQDGYGAFSVGQTQIETVKKYIARQKVKHGTQTFEDEFRAFLRKYNVAYDERYVWD